MTNNFFAVYLAVLSVGFGALVSTGSELQPDLTLWYQQPAADNKPMDEALPIGNGRMGALVFGSPERERINVNESSLWTGDENPSGNYDTMGAYQVLGNIYVNLPGHTNAENYRRGLNLEDAVSGVGYTVNGVKFERQFFCSHPAEVLVAEFMADHKGAYTGSIELVDAHRAIIKADRDRITASGSLDNGMKFEWQMQVLHQGGTISVISDATSPRLEFKDCDSLTLLIARTQIIFLISRKTITVIIRTHE
jgi:alpha-L-fucosidase 2